MPFIRLNAVRGGKTAHRGIKCLKKRRKSACTRTRFMLLSQGKRLTPQTHALMVKRLRRRPLTAESGVRFPMRVPKKAAEAAFFLYLDRGTKKGSKSCFFLFTSTGVPKKAAKAAFFLYLTGVPKKAAEAAFFIYLDCEKRAGNVCISKCRGRYLHKKTPRRY